MFVIRPARTSFIADHPDQTYFGVAWIPKFWPTRGSWFNVQDLWAGTGWTNNKSKVECSQLSCGRHLDMENRRLHVKFTRRRPFSSFSKQVSRPSRDRKSFTMSRVTQ